MVTSYNGKDCIVYLYIDSVTPGAKPSGTDTWVSVGSTVAIATSVSVNQNKTITPHYGLNNPTPQVIKQGNITYEFSLEGVYTTKEYGAMDVIEMIDHGVQFAMNLEAQDATPATDLELELEYCVASSVNVEVSDDGDLTFSMSGQGTTRTLTVAA